MYDSLYSLTPKAKAAAFASLGQMRLPKWRSLTNELAATTFVIDGVPTNLARTFDFTVAGVDEASVSMAEVWDKLGFVPGETSFMDYRAAMSQAQKGLGLLNPSQDVSEHFNAIYNTAKTTCDQGRNPETGAAVTHHDGFDLYTSWDFKNAQHAVNSKVTETGADPTDPNSGAKAAETLLPNSPDTISEVQDTVNRAKNDCDKAKAWSAGALPWLGWKMGLVPVNYND